MYINQDIFSMSVPSSCILVPLSVLSHAYPEMSPGSLCSASTFACAHNGFFCFVLIWFFCDGSFFSSLIPYFSAIWIFKKKKKVKSLMWRAERSCDNRVIDTRSARWRFIAVSYIWKTRSFSVSLAGSDQLLTVASTLAHTFRGSILKREEREQLITWLSTDIFQH